MSPNQGGYFDPYLIVDRRLQGILRGRILKTEIRYDFSHSLGQQWTFIDFGRCHLNVRFPAVSVIPSHLE